jgi:dienelactone hydrolase
VEQVNRIEESARKVCLLLTAGALIWLVRSQVADPGNPGPCTVTSQMVDVNGDLETHIHYPSGDQCGGGITAPYPAIAFAHGFSMFGLSNGAADNAGNGEHLASWGYVVAIPVLPDDVEGRIADMRDVLFYLEAESNTAGSFLYQKVDVDRLAVAGHSFGGATVLALAARDARVKAVVALDPVYHQGGPFPGDEPEIWDPNVEGPNITVPTCVLGAPASNCNSEADYAEIYPFIGATHKAMFLVANASHCDFMDPGHFACDWVCDGTTDPARTELVHKYMTAWFNYYLHLNTDCYDHLYGTEADTDVAAGLIERQVDTAPRGLMGSSLGEAVRLLWELYEHPIVAGYNIYRRLPGEAYTATPDAQLERTSTYLDVGLLAGQVYSYTIRSRDAAGNLHQSSGEVSAVPVNPTLWTYLPMALHMHR